jgi:anaerobic magnesium-protoporphyrin IX monomethyl ester cyclase
LDCLGILPEEEVNILIIVPRYAGRIVDYYNLPMGLLYVASQARKNNNVSILNLNEVMPQDYERVIKYRAKEADVVMTGGLSTHYGLVKEIVDIVKRCEDVLVVVGGGLVSSQPEVISENLNADIFVAGEAETFSMFELGPIRKIVRTNTVAKKDLDNLLPAYDLFNMELYLGLQRPSDSHYRDIVDSPRELAVIASRGCPFNCTFCFHPTGNSYRQRSLDSVFSEIEMLKENYGINIIAVYDELFSSDKPRLMEFCERIRKLGLHWSCQLRVDSVDKESMKLLKDSRCYIISFGIESASDFILENFRKHTTVKQINNALGWAKEFGIVVQGNIIFGAEGETKETLAESVKWWNEHKEYSLSVGPVIPYPGTLMYKHMLDAGKIDPVKFLEAECPALNCSKMSNEDYAEILKDVVSPLPVQIYDVGYEQSLDFYGRVKLAFKVKCPYCGFEQQHTNYAMDMVGAGIKWCKNCAGRYFMKGQ